MQGSTLIPSESDTSLLFTSAGMVQFKPRFLATSKEPSASFRPANVVTVQRCLRAGGKDCDLENVGKTNRHMTMFEMLGNFSFGNTEGSYFKEQAIGLAYEFMAKTLALPKERLVVTHLKEDEETRRIWENYFPSSQIKPMGRADNWWAMGHAVDSPCGPCTELYYRLDDGSLLEVWNLVFMQFTVGGEALKFRSVDTGMGLERLCSVLEKVPSNFDIAAFRPLMEQASKLLELPMQDPTVRVIADHARAATVLIADGVACGPLGRGYVLRRLIRRAARHAFLRGIRDPVLHQLIPSVFFSLDRAYPELESRADLIASVLKSEEHAFHNNLGPGLKFLKQGVQGGKISAECVFTLNSQFGFPYDLTAAICQEQSVQMCESSALQTLEARHRDVSQSGQFDGNGGVGGVVGAAWQQMRGGPFRYEPLAQQGSKTKVVQVMGDWVSLDPCPFYATQGGQPADRGTLCRLNDKVALRVIDVRTVGENQNVICVDGGAQQLRVGDEVVALVDEAFRKQVSAHHTATHLVQSALKKHLSPLVHQCGSKINEEALRFDFYVPPECTQSNSEIAQLVQQFVDGVAAAGLPVATKEQPLSEATSTAGVTYLYGEQYPAIVRVVQVADRVSAELCAGTHCDNTRDLFPFQVLSVKSVGSNVKRIEAAASVAAVNHLRREARDLRALLERLNCFDTPSALRSIVNTNERLEQFEKREKQVPLSTGAAVESLVVSQRFNIHVVSGADSNVKGLGHKLRSESPGHIHIVHSTGSKHVVVILDSKVHSNTDARTILAHVFASTHGGKGGGNMEMATGVASQPLTLAIVEQSLLQLCALENNNATTTPPTK